MIRTCSHCHRVVGTRNCPFCGSERTVPVENKPEDRARDREKREPPPAIAMPVGPELRPRLVRVVYRRGKPPVFKPLLKRAA